MTRHDRKMKRISKINRDGAIMIPSAETGGVGKSVAGAEDAKALARESAGRARRIAGRG